MVIRTFHQPRANEPVDAQRLTSSSAPFVILAHGVRWHAGVSYGYPHLLSTRGKWARWHAETNIVFCTFCHPGTASQVAGGDTLWSSAPFINQEERIRRYQDDVGRSILIILKFFAGFYPRRPKTFKLDETRDSSLLGGDDRVQWRREVSWLSNFVTFKTLKFVDASDAFSFISEWQVPLVGILTDQMTFRSNEISVLSLLRFYFQ